MQTITRLKKKNNLEPKLKTITRNAPVKVGEEMRNIVISKLGVDEKTTSAKSVYTKDDEEFEFSVNGSSHLFAR